MSKVETIKVEDKDDDLRLDRWFKDHHPELQFGKLQKLLRTGQIRVDGKRAKTSTRLEAGQMLRIPPFVQNAQTDNVGRKTTGAKERRPSLAKEAHIKEITDLILHEDDDLMVLNKPSGLAVQGGSKTNRHIDGMLGAFEFNGERPRLVHRLDRDTSGLLLIAKSRKAASKMGAVFRTRSARKIYWALTHGVPRPLQGEISAFLMKQPSPIGEIVQVVGQGTPGAQHSHSYYSVVEQAGQRLAWVSLKPVTGRTHQLRVHMAQLGTPIMGDPKYMEIEEEQRIEGFADKLHLHARRLVIPHPRGGTLDLTAPLPDHMQESWEALGFDPFRYDSEAEMLD